MTRSCSCGSDAATKAATEISEIADLLADVFCTCRDETRFEIGTMACELFRRVDLEGQHLEVAANALALDPRDAAAVLAVVRRHVARALVEDISAGSIADPRR